MNKKSGRLKFIKGAVFGFLLAAAIPVAMVFANPQIVEAIFGVNVTLNGEALAFKEIDMPFIVDGRTFLPLRAMADALGFDVQWDSATQTAHIFSGFSHARQLGRPPIGAEIAVIHTSLGDITVQFFPEIAPLAVENFITHARNGFYDGIIFHRVIENFMIQGGDPTGTGTGGESIWGYEFADEFHAEARHIRGALSMANRGANTNGSQFFIVNSHNGQPHLNFGHTVFGQVIDGWEALDAISTVATNYADRPLQDVYIISITVANY